jgi:hypothetical protein
MAAMLDAASLYTPMPTHTADADATAPPRPDLASPPILRQVDRIEARQLELTETVAVIHASILALAEAVKQLKDSRRPHEDNRGMSIGRGMSSKGGFAGAKSLPPRHGRRSKERIERRLDHERKPSRDRHTSRDRNEDRADGREDSPSASHQRTTSQSSAHGKGTSHGDRTQSLAERPRGSSGAKLVDERHDRKPPGRSAKEFRNELLDARINRNLHA